MIRPAGLISALAVFGAPAFACDRSALQVDVVEAGTPVVLTIDPACLTTAEATGQVMADVARVMIDAHLVADPNTNYAAVWEVVAESFVHEILEPSLPEH